MGDLIARGLANKAAIAPRLNLNFLAARLGGVYTSDDSELSDFIFLVHAHQVFNNLVKNTGPVYGLEAYRTDRTTQKIVYSFNGGYTWTLLGTVPSEATARYVQIFVEPLTYHVYLLKESTVDGKKVHWVDSYEPDLLTLNGSLDIGGHTWLSTNSIDALKWGENYIVMFAEYHGVSGADITDINVWKTVNHGVSWTKAHTLPCVGTSHYHTCQVDPHTYKWWISTGDTDCNIYSSATNGASWITNVSARNQEYRTTSFLFEEDYMYWGMDSPFQTPYIYRANKDDPTIKTAIGYQPDGHPIRALTRTTFPKGFITWSASESVNPHTERSLFGFYDLATNRYYPDILRLPHNGIPQTNTIGISSASKYADPLSGIIVADIGNQLLDKYGYGGYDYPNVGPMISAKIIY